MTTLDRKHAAKQPEPVPPASQLAALPFLAALDGYLRGANPKNDVRLTLHRAMTREGEEYLQQICDYVGSDKAASRRGSGRLFLVDQAIIGAAYREGKVFRTRFFSTKEALLTELPNEPRPPETRPLSWLAVPFLSNDGAPVLVLFGESNEFNYFSKPEQTNIVVDMCWGFCRLIDSLDEQPFATLRNFGFEPAQPAIGGDPAFGVQEAISDLQAPRFRRVRSFNFEAAVG